MSEKPLSEVYLFNGDDNLKREMLVDRLKKRLEAMGDLTMNMHVLSDKDIQSPLELIDILNTMPFGSAYRFVLIKEADKLKKPVTEALVGYIERPSVTTVLVMTADKLAKNTRLYKAIEKFSPASIIDCGQKKRSELPQLIRGVAQAEGVEVSVAAANLLIDRVGTSTVALSTEIKKLAAMVKSQNNKTISEADIKTHVAILVEPRSWDLTNALALRDMRLCLRLIARMKGYTDVGLFAICVSRVREILLAQSLRARGASVAQKMGKQDWQLREIYRGCDLYSAGKLRALLRQAPELERQMKTGADTRLLLEQWIIDACTG